MISKNKKKDPRRNIGYIKENQEIIDFLEYREKNKSEYALYKVKCNFCNYEYTSFFSNIVDKRKTGKSCKKCSNIQNKTYIALSIEDNQINTIFSNYKSRAKYKKWKFDLNKEEFKNLIISNCYYCNQPPNKWRSDHIKNKRQGNASFVSNGIDRIDSFRGYEIDNVRPCCEDCNKAKRNLDTVDFLKMIKSIYENLELDKLTN